MISTNSVELSLSAAQYFATKGLAVRAKPDTPIHSLVGTVAPLLTKMDLSNIAEGLNDTNTSMPDYIQGLANFISLASDTKEYDGAVEELSAVVSTAVKQHFSFAKNTVLPLVLDYTAHMQNFKDSYTPKSASASFNIVQYELPSLMTDPAFLESMRPYKDDVRATPALSLSLGVKNIEEVSGLMYLGERDADALITELVTNNVELLSEIYSSVFSLGMDPTFKTKITSLDDYRKLHEFDKVKVYLSIYLMANGLMSKVEDTAMTLSQYNNALSDVKNWAGCNLMSSLGLINGYAKNKFMIISFDPSNKVCGVYGDIYRTWLATGGKPEVLMGLLVMGRQVTTVTNIDASANEASMAWHRYVGAHDVSEVNKTINYFKSALRANSNLLISNVTDEERKLNVNLLGNIAKYFEVAVNEVTNQDMLSLEDTCLRVVCRSRFYFTDAEKILLGINQASKNNPDLSVQEAAFVSMTNYVTDYVTDQLYLTANV